MTTTFRARIDLLLLLLVVPIALACSREAKQPAATQAQIAPKPVAPKPVIPAAPRKPEPPFQAKFGDITAFTTENVKRFLSTTMNPEKDMTLPIRGIAMVGNIRLAGADHNPFSASNANARLAPSELAIYVIDEQTVQKNKPAITIGFKRGSLGYSMSGEVLRGRFATMTFVDQYGSVTLEGMFDRDMYRGTVFYTLKNGIDAQQRYPLGDFRVPTCGFFHC